MKFKTYFTALVFLVSVFSYAQMRFGAKAGAGKSNFTDIHVNSKGRIGMNLGLVGLQPFERYNFRDFIQFELSYVNHGEKVGDIKRYANYLSLPVMYKRYLSEKDIDLYIEVGPQFSYAVADNFEEYEIKKLNGKTIDSSDNHILNKFDFSFGLGGGISIHRRLELDLRYNYGLIDAFNYKYHDNGKNRTSLLAFSLIYFFNEY